MAPRKSLKTHSEFNELNYLLSYMGTCEPQDELRALNTSRNQPAHGVLVSPSSPTIVYLTLCCEKRVPWLAKERHHEILLDVWQDTSHWVVGRYVLMPDHLHLFAAPQESAVDFDSWVQYFKSQFTKRNKNPSCVWQTGHWDTRIRNMLLRSFCRPPLDAPKQWPACSQLRKARQEPRPPDLRFC